MYEQDFEAEFLAQTREYYQSKSAHWTQEDTFPDYMRKAEGESLSSYDPMLGLIAALERLWWVVSR